MQKSMPKKRRKVCRKAPQKEVKMEAESKEEIEGEIDVEKGMKFNEKDEISMRKRRDSLILLEGSGHEENVFLEKGKCAETI